VLEPSTTRTSDLQVIVAEDQLEVVLGGLPPVYARGLQTLLHDSGAVGTVIQDFGPLGVLLAGPKPLVVIVPDLAHLAAALPAAPAFARHAVVVLVDEASPDTCADALRAGATGVITPLDDPQDVLAVLRCAGRGQTVLARAVVQALCRPATLKPPSLTDDEQAWLRRLAAGGTVAGLARGCGYSEREMYRRLSDMYSRLGARTRTEALLLAERFGLLDTRV
jgi:DNA-binding NarL/FixJ family response regulator